MRTSATGRALIEAREGRRLSAYRDSMGVLTIGIGHTGRMSPPSVMPGMTISEAQCDAMLAADLAPVEEAVNTAVRVPLSQNEFDALVSLGFNIGTPALRRSRVIAQINRGDFAAAADAFLLWSKPASLTSRRNAERAQFQSPDAAVNGDASQGSRLAAARGAVLSGLSAQAAQGARRAQTAATSLIVVGGAGAVAAQVRHHTAALTAGGIVLAVGVALAILALAYRWRARGFLTQAYAHFHQSLISGARNPTLSSDTEVRPS